MDMNEEDEAKTCVFWDMEDCPIPEGLNPHSVYRNIRAALANKGYRGEVTITAYGDKNQIPGYFESAGISLIPAGDKYARFRRMRLDFWSPTIENRECPISFFTCLSLCEYTWYH
ncbi:unnamed protein product [Thlaspi arvense]|uniref:NYN domain-containing protein n=1 Tax=Thlaspi arvense TaxID=13288 RepID=A0AAU9SM28_THLAR|nr:unnamed protein product [Thlaspi arvense]